jgi:acetoin utilization deacetylase AcuC-like enzyme
MKAFYSDQFVLPLPAGHRFPMSKYLRLRERITGDPGLELRVPDAATDAELLRVHAPGYLRGVVEGTLSREAVRRIGFPWSPDLVERSRRSVGGTIGAARAALDDGRGANLAGGTHHAYADRGEGFCVFNDVAVATRVLQAEGRLRRVAILDLDVHQGNGTAVIFRRDPSVATLSVHGASNYPFRKEESDLDVALPDGTRDAAFLDAVDTALHAVRSHAPDLLFYVAGADAYEHDKLGRLSVTPEGLAERDRRVYRTADDLGVPVAVVMAGGYAPDVDRIVEIHAHTVREAARTTPRPT